MKDSFQTIIGLFIVLAIILSMGLQFSNKEGFQNTGNVGKNFNRALSVASGDFVTFISCDDYYYSDMASFQMSSCLLGNVRGSH